MLENAFTMIYQDTATKENSAAAASSTARQIAEILRSKNTQFSKANTAKLALPSARQTTTSTLTPDNLPQETPGQSPLLKSATRTFFNSLTSKDTTSTILSAPLVSLSATARAKAATAVATKFSSAATATFRAKEIFTSLTPAYFLKTLAATIATNVKNNNRKSKSSSNNNNSKSSSWSNTKTIEAEKATNIIVRRHMSQQYDNKNEIYHMLSLNHLKSINVLQHHQQQQQQKQHRPQRQCRNKHLQQQQQQKFEQFLLLLTCFVAIITIFSLPHLSRAAVATATTSHMSTTYETPTTTVTADAKTIKSLTITNPAIKTLEELMSPTFNSSTDNESKDDDSSYSNSSNHNNNKNKIAGNSDNVDNLTSFSPFTTTTTIENSLRDFRPSSGSRSSRQSFLGGPIIIRLKRSLDVSGNSGGVAVGGGSGISSIFSPSPVGSAGLTNIFNQNLDTGLSNNIECPSFDESSACPCYKFEDGK